MLDDSLLVSDESLEKIRYFSSDSRIVCDMLSMCFDGCVANEASRSRVTNTLEKQVFHRLSSLYRGLAERLFNQLGAQLPQDSGTMNPEPGYIATAYLAAMNASDKKFTHRVMIVNWQVIKRVGMLVRKLQDRRFAKKIVDDLACIQMVLDTTQQRRKSAKLSR